MPDRITLVGPSYPYRGGIAHFTNRFAQALGQRNRPVDILTFSRQYPSFLFPGRTQFETADWKLPAQPVRLIDSINPLTWRTSARWIAEHRPHTVVFFYWMPFVVPAYLSIIRWMRPHIRRMRLTPPHIVLWLHNLLPHESIPLTQYFTLKLIENADHFVCLSEEVGRDLLDLREEIPVMKAFHPVYDIFKPQISQQEARRRLDLPDKPTILFFGLVRYYKGLDVLLNAVPRILEQRDVQVIVAGEFYERRSDYDMIMKETGLSTSNCVTFIDQYIPNDQVHLYFSAADVVIQPYRSATQSGVVQTAYAFDKPVIVTDVGGLSEVVPHRKAGFVVPPEDPTALAEAVLEFFTIGPEAFITGVRETAAAYSWDSLAQNFERFIGYGIRSS